VSDAIKRQDTIDAVVLKGQVDSNTAINTQTAIGLRDIALENFKRQAAAANPEMNVTTVTGGDGSSYVVVTPQDRRRFAALLHDAARTGRLTANRLWWWPAEMVPVEVGKQNSVPVQ